MNYYCYLIQNLAKYCVVGTAILVQNNRDREIALWSPLILTLHKVPRLTSPECKVLQVFKITTLLRHLKTYFLG